MPDYLLTEELQREARHCFKQLAKVFGGVSDNQKSLPIAVKEHLASKDIRSNSLATLKSSLKSFAAFYPDETVQSITCEKIDAWMAAGDYAAKSRKNRLTNLKSFFSRCVKRGQIEKDPTMGVEIPMVDYKPPQIMPVADVGKLLLACQKSDPALLGYLALILFGGLRSKESARVKPENVHDGIVDIGGAATKLNVRRCFPIQPVLSDWLDVPGVEIGGKNIYARFVALRKLAGVDVPDNGLRHTAVSCWLPILGAEKCAAMHGHSPSIMMKHYASLVTKEDAEKYIALRPAPQTP
jgi:hypothetical protein